MSANYSNQSMLDMVFEHRNKAYGAYVLRNDYNKSLKQAMLSVLFFVTLLCVGNYVRELLHSKKIADADQHSVFNAQQIEKRHTIIPPKPPAEPKRAKPAPIATADNREKKVVNNPLLADTVPANKDIANLESGLKTNTTPTGTIGATDGTGREHVMEAAKETQPPAPPAVLNFAEVMPEYPGGEKALMDFLANNTQYPAMERDNDIGGTVVSQFTVNEDGTISDVKILRSPSNGFNHEVDRVIKLLPPFKPGMQQGHTVKVRYILPITFHLK